MISCTCLRFVSLFPVFIFLPLVRAQDDLAAFADGSADATHVLQTLINAGNGGVTLPHGVFRITRTLNVDLAANGLTAIRGNGTAVLLMDGSGPAIRIKGSHYRSADPKGFTEEIWSNERMPVIDGLAITAATPDADGIEATGTMQLTVTRTHVRGCRHAVRLIENNRNVILSDCHFYENSGAGLLLDNVNLHQINVTGCHISYNSAGGVVCRGGNVRNLHITGCDIESNMGNDHPGTANVLIDCTGSDYGIAEVAISGCTIQHNHTGQDTANIRIIGRSNSTESQAVVREGHVTLTGNVLSDTHTNIHLQECRGVTLSGNTFWMGFRHNLLVQSCSDVVAAANNFDRNPRYAYGDAATAENAVVFEDCDACTLTGMHLRDVHAEPAALVLRRCTRMNISGCSVLDVVGTGVLLEEVHDSLVTGILIGSAADARDVVPVRVVGGSGNSITGLPETQ